MKSTYGFAVLVGLLAVTMVLGGCAAGSKVPNTEEGYMPSHVAVGEIIVYTQGVAQVSTSDVKAMIISDLESAFREQGVHFVSLREMDTTPVAATDMVKLNATITFQQKQGDFAQNVDARYNYSLTRSSDDYLWNEGSAKTTDWTVSTNASMDVQSAIRFGAQATVRDVKELMQ